MTGDDVSGDEICRCNKIGESDSCGAAGGNGGKPVREHQTFLLKVFFFIQLKFSIKYNFLISSVLKHGFN